MECMNLVMNTITYTFFFWTAQLPTLATWQIIFSTLPAQELKLG